MSHSRAPLLASALFCLFALLATLLPSLGRAQTAAHVVISEVMYDPVCSTTETDCEWIEIFNPTTAAINLAGWKVKDNFSQDTLPAFSLEPEAYLVIAAKAASFAEAYPGFGGSLIGLNGPVGNGLANSGDQIFLLDSGDLQVDTVSYGSNTTAFNPACPTVPEGQSLARAPSDRDTDTRDDWFPQASPNPGAAGIAAPSPISRIASPPCALSR